MPPLITLTTDFGLTDEYAAVMKGVIYSRCPEAVIVDLSHEVPPHDIRRASRLVASAYRYFPQHTVHVVVVDPGVGSSRRIILLEAAGQLFLAPDNGVLTLLFSQMKSVFAVTNSDFFLLPVSHTFHGRDIFAPLAALLACGCHPSNAGPQVSEESLIRLDMFAPKVFADRLLGEVTDIDHFGNLITNIDRAILGKFCSGDFGKLRLQIDKLAITGIANAYNETDGDRPIALIGSRGLVEISIYQASAAEKLLLGTGTAVCLTIE